MKTKKYTKVMLTLLVGVSILLQINSVALASIMDNQGIKVRRDTIFSTKLDLFSEQAREVSTIKTLLDFSDNNYTLIESMPTGYMIYHDASGLFVELSEDAPSPYLGYNDNLYYGGPTEYYVLNGDTFCHTIVDEKYDVSKKSDFSMATSQANASFVEIADTAVLDYIQSGKLNGQSKESILSPTQEATRTASLPTSYEIPGSYIIANLPHKDDFGYYSVNNGLCGYVAAGLVLLWHRTIINSNYVPSTYVTTNSNGSVCYTGGDFTKYLYNTFGSSSGTWALTIDSTVSSYLQSRGMNVTANCIIVPFTAGIKDDLYTYGRPYILFGRLNEPSGGNPGDHAVTVYGYNSNGLRCHYGWQGYNSVYVTGVWGSGYQIIG